MIDYLYEVDRPVLSNDELELSARGNGPTKAAGTGGESVNTDGERKCFLNKKMCHGLSRCFREEGTS